MSDPVAQLIFLLIKAVLMPVLIILIVAFAIFFERKFAGFFQGRVGPTYLGPWGSFQSFGDILKLLSKEDLIPARADKRVFRLGALHRFRPCLPGHGRAAFRPGGGRAQPVRTPLRLGDRQLRFRHRAVPGYGGHRGLRVRAGRLVVKQQLLAAWRPAGRRPDDLLRVGHGLRGGGGHTHGRVDEPGGRRRRSKRRLLALVLLSADRGRD